MSVQYFIGAILLKNSYQMGGLEKKIKKGGWPYGGVSIGDGIEIFCTL